MLVFRNHQDTLPRGMSPTSAPMAQNRFASEDVEVDVVVVGFGAAGSCAAIEARSQGAEVLVIDRFRGGGATARSGGVVYFGGGSAQQKAAGYVDDPEQMFRYLALEVRDAVDEDTLRRFCQESLATLAWLENLGVAFPPSRTAPAKTSYPMDDCTLYFSGNELAYPYSTAARPAPRGHRVPGAGLTGPALFTHLRRATERSGAQLRYCSRALRLLTDTAGRVCGVEIVSLPEASFGARWHSLLFHLAAVGAIVNRRMIQASQRALARLEARLGRRWNVKARSGVILCAGGFAFNPEMMKEYAPGFVKSMPLGTVGDDGGGILLGQSVGGAVGQMDRCAAWRFINPPEAFTYGILVDAQGQRICNEELYGATLGERIAQRAGGHAFLVIDAEMAAKAREQIRRQQGAGFQKVSAFINLFLNRKKAMRLDDLAARCGMPGDALAGTVEAYNSAALQGGPDAFGKAAALCRPIRTPPYYAINCDLANSKFLTPCLTLGGLRVDGFSGQVLRQDGSPIAGLYAAGRDAVGVASHSYISGLSIADCIFSGRNAGRHAATARATS